MTLLALWFTSIVPPEKPIGLVAPAVLIAQLDKPSPPYDGLSGPVKIGIFVGIAIFSVLLVAGIITSLLWWRRRKMKSRGAIPSTRRHQSDGFELLSK